MSPTISVNELLGSPNTLVGSKIETEFSSLLSDRGAVTGYSYAEARDLLGPPSNSGFSESFAHVVPNAARSGLAAASGTATSDHNYPEGGLNLNRLGGDDTSH
jgi:hypothetical protein